MPGNTEVKKKNKVGKKRKKKVSIEEKIKSTSLGYKNVEAPTI